MTVCVCVAPFPVFLVAPLELFFEWRVLDHASVRGWQRVRVVVVALGLDRVYVAGLVAPLFFVLVHHIFRL